MGIGLLALAIPSDVGKLHNTSVFSNSIKRDKNQKATMETKRFIWISLGVFPSCVLSVFKDSFGFQFVAWAGMSFWLSV